MRLYAYGRMALYEGLKTLGITSGQVVLLPAYICREVLAPFHALGIVVRYYEVDQRLEPRLETAAPLIDERTRALLAVHYFGFPHQTESVRAFCRQHRLAYIEDNAHGYLSAAGNAPLGTFGDIAIFSFRKSLPVPHGAALLLNSPDLVLPPPSSRKGSSADLMSFAARTGIRALEIATHLDLVTWLRKDTSCRDTDREERSPVQEWDGSFSVIAQAIARRLDSDLVRHTRRQTYGFWLEQSEHWARWGAEPLMADLPPGVVPYALPLRVQDHKGFRDMLGQQGVSCFTWPDFPRAVRAGGTQRELMLVPVHRDPLKGCLR